MKAITSILGLILIVFSLSDCAGVHDNDLSSESYWNHLGIWRRVPGTPASYVPTEYALGKPTNDKKGRWLADERDGKRLFVPHGGVDHWGEGMLLGEARKITHAPPDQQPDHLADDVKEVVLSPVAMCAWVFGKRGR